MEDENIGKAKGGYARAAKLTPEERKAIAQKAAKERWEGPRLPKVMKVGVIKIGDIEIPCAVLENGIRVLRERSIAKAFGKRGGGAHWKRKKSHANGAHLPEYVSAKNLAEFINEDVKIKLSNPISYVTKTESEAWALPAILLPEICDIWLKARENGALSDIQLSTARQAEIILKGFAHIGIIALVDEATGYQEERPKDALQAYLEMLVRKELAAWAKKFPDEFYENIYKLKGWQWPGMKKNRFSIVAHYTNDLVYERIAPGLLQELKNKTPKDETGQRKNKLHQFLTEDIGDPMLAQHLHSLVMFQRLALKSGYGWHRFVKMVDKVLPKRGATLELPFMDETDSNGL